MKKKEMYLAPESEVIFLRLENSLLNNMSEKNPLDPNDFD